MEKVCDHKSVGMLVWRDDKLLLIERARFPFGFAPPAGHCDMEEFNIYEYPAIAKRELREEVGLESKSLTLIIEGRKENPCRRIDGTWHYWQIFEVEAEGEINRSIEETKQVVWTSREELKKLAKRTEEFLEEKISQEDWDINPGIEPIWYEWMKELKII